jgi:hypothetical protein
MKYKRSVVGVIGYICGVCDTLFVFCLGSDRIEVMNKVDSRLERFIINL